KADDRVPHGARGGPLAERERGPEHRFERRRAFVFERRLSRLRRRRDRPRSRGGDRALGPHPRPRVAASRQALSGSRQARQGGIMRKTVLALVAASLAATLAPSAGAFCGFYVSGADAKLFNNATQVVLMREGQRTVLSMQNNYQGPPESFAMVVP